jgi:hypothetical protein
VKAALERLQKKGAGDEKRSPCTTLTFDGMAVALVVANLPITSGTIED